MMIAMNEKSRNNATAFPTPTAELFHVFLISQLQQYDSSSNTSLLFTA
jgi:hypothetical protein